MRKLTIILWLLPVIVFAQVDSTGFHFGDFHIAKWIWVVIAFAGEAILQKCIGKIHNNYLISAIALLAQFFNWLNGRLPSGKLKQKLMNDVYKFKK